MGKLATTPGADLAIKINAAHRSARGSAKQALEHMAECGRLLIEAKRTVRHGEWESWVEAHTEVGYRQCVRYMRLAEGWEQIEAESDSESLLGLNDALKRIAKPKAEPEPEMVVQSVTSACGTPLWHRAPDGTYVDSSTGELLPGGDDNDEDDEDELPNTGCNYDPADPRGWYKDEGTKVVRRRAWLYMAAHAKEQADWFTAAGGHRAIAIADPDEIDDEVIKAAAEAITAWMRVLSELQKKQASTLPQDGRSEGGRG